MHTHLQKPMRPPTQA